MVAYKSFAVVGVGSLGTHIVNQLLTHNISVKILTRDDTKHALAAFKENGATIVKVDYSNEEELKSALTGVEVVVSVIGQLGLDAQVGIAKVAKAAGVQLFVPAEYGISVTEGFTRHKKVVQDALKELDLPYTVFYTGMFAESFHNLVGWDYANGKMRVVGTGDLPLSMTSRLDIARFVAHALATAEPNDLKWAKIGVEGDRKTPNEIAAIVAKKRGKPTEIEYIDLEENRKEYTTVPRAFFTTVIADGKAISGPADEVKATIAKFFPHWNPTPLEELIIV